MAIPPGGTPLDIAAVIDRVLQRNINFPVRAVVAAGTTALSILNRKVTVDATAGNITLTLPTALLAAGLGAGAGMDFEIKRLDATANTVTVQSAVGGQTIDGAASFSISKQYQSAIFTSNGVNYLTFYAPTLEMVVAYGNTAGKNVKWPYRAISTTPENILITDYYISISAAGGNRVLTLPSAVTVGAGVGFKIIRIDGTLANTVTIATTGGQTINGASSASIGLQYSSLEIVSDGANWLLFASPAAYALSSDVLWTFPGQLSTDQGSSIFELKAKRAMAFVAFDIDVRVAPTGATIIVDWLKNGVLEPTWQVVLTGPATFAQTVVSGSLAVDDTLRPSVTQVGAQTPGQTMVMRARGQ